LDVYDIPVDVYIFHTSLVVLPANKSYIPTRQRSLEVPRTTGNT